MKLNTDHTGIATRSGFVAPDLGAGWAAVRPQTARLRVDGHTTASFADTEMSAATGVGHRSWSPPIT